MRFLGDVHGKFAQLGAYIVAHPHELIFQVGDMGLGFGHHLERRAPNRLQFIRGNHDDPAACQRHANYAGDWGHIKLTTGDHGLDGMMFFLGGAFSIDAGWRKAYMMQSGGRAIWWPDEELADEQLAEAHTEYFKIKPQVVVTHEAPSFVGKRLLFGLGIRGEKEPCCRSRTALALQQMWEEWQPQLWVFGHYHASRAFEVAGTKFQCLNELELSWPLARLASGENSDRIEVQPKGEDA